jgi:3-hydroxyacyl-CoA dehydrogenase
MEFARGKHLLAPGLGYLVDFLDSYDLPVVASIHGAALGGGLELALACHWRLGTRMAKVGLPEVHLGLLPGAGGTQRLPRLVGAKHAIDLMTTGRTVGYQEAIELQVLDKVLSADGKADNDHDLVSDVVQKENVISRRISSRSCPGDASEALFQDIEREVSLRARDFLAPTHIVKAVRAATTSAVFRDGMDTEARLFSELMAHKQSKALQYFFFSEKRTTANISKIPKDLVVPKLEKVGVLGGTDIGIQWAKALLAGGLQVSVVDESLESLQRVTAAAPSSKLKSGAKLVTGSNSAVLSDSHLVIDATERGSLAEVQRIAGANTVIATCSHPTGDASPSSNAIRLSKSGPAAL